MARVWTCQGVSRGVKCGHRNPSRLQLCALCGKRKRPRRAPAHRAALDEPYEAWIATYGELCGICDRPPKPGRKLHRDHDHRTGEPRGLLCFPCNSALRTYMTEEWLARALTYVRRGS